VTPSTLDVRCLQDKTETTPGRNQREYTTVPKPHHICRKLTKNFSAITATGASAKASKSNIKIAVSEA